MKRIIPLAIIPLLLGVLYLTNPEKKDFTRFMERTMQEHASDLPESYTEMLEESGIKLNNIATMASLLTKRDNYIFFSLYELNFPGQRLKFLGIGTFFVPLELPTA